ncbi:MAG: RnfABCDGE type electron transport complex subunit D [bacterium]
MRIENADTYIITDPPHIRDTGSVSRAMYDVMLALIPALAAATIYFGFTAIYLALICITSTVTSEVIIRFLLRKQITVWDGSAILTGLLLSMCLPLTTPWYLAVIGSSLAIIVGKELFGGLGRNILNPALVGRIIIFFFIPYKKLLSNYVAPFWWRSAGFFTYISSKATEGGYTIMTGSGGRLDGITGATPMAIKRFGGGALPHYLSLLIGNVRGNMGETSALALLIGALYLIYKKHIDWYIPLSIIVSFAIIVSLWGHDPLFHILAGGFMLGAFFMATDWVTSPSTKKGKVIYGVAIGVFVAGVRIFGVKTEGMGEAILHMNILAQFLDHFTQPTPFGG